MISQRNRVRGRNIFLHVCKNMIISINGYRSLLDSPLVTAQITLNYVLTHT